mgnify:CR=1 FL=1
MAHQFVVGDRVEVTDPKHASVGTKGKVTKVTPADPGASPPRKEASYTIQPDNQNASIDATDGQLTGAK